MIKVKVGSRTVRILRQWEKDMLAAVAIAAVIMLWITGTLGAWT